jgi:hypothetical protein
MPRNTLSLNSSIVIAPAGLIYDIFIPARLSPCGFWLCQIPLTVPQTVQALPAIILNEFDFQAVNPLQNGVGLKFDQDRVF